MFKINIKLAGLIKICEYVIYVKQCKLTVNNIPVNEYIAQKLDIPSSLETKHDINPRDKNAN